MQSNQLPPALNAAHDELEQIKRVGTAGVVVSFNYTWRGPEYFLSTYPETWKAEYEDKNYYAKDPILLWAIAFSGDKRWSEVKFPDLLSIMKRASANGLSYGAVFSRFVGKKRSVMSVSRSDRELTDDEMTNLSETFDRFVDLVEGSNGLSNTEILALQSLLTHDTQDVAAQSLGIATITLKNHLKSARKKLGCATTLQAISIATERKFIQLPTN